MSIEEQFNRIANEYDTNRRIFIPCFDEYYEKTTNFITANIAAPKRIMDLGAGTGLLTYYWYQHFDKSQYCLVDIANEMLNVARKRFLNIPNIKFEVMDYRNSFPEMECDCIISALSIHHLEDEEKKALFSNIYGKLPIGGIFVNYDQFCGGSSTMYMWFNTYWINRLENSCLTSKDIEQWKERRKLDREISVDAEMQLLQECNFKEVNCVYLNQKFAVIVAVK